MDNLYPILKSLLKSSITNILKWF